MDPYYLIGDDLEEEADYAEMELLGELLGEQDPILGARAPLHRRVMASRGRPMAARRRIKTALVPQTPGVPKPGARELPLGFSTIQFTETSALVLVATATPQVPFKGRRLVIDVVRSASGSGGLITINDIKCGQRSQPVSAQPLIAAGFGPTSVSVDMALDPVTPGNIITITIGATAQPGAGETVDIGMMLIGLSVA